MGDNNSKRNGLIDLERIIFAIMIILLHSENYRESIMPNGYIAVEFFFVVSGYLLAKKAENYKGTDIWNDNIRFLWRKYLSIFPYLIVSIIFGIVLYRHYIPSDDTVFMTILKAFVDYFPLQMFGFSGTIISGVSWYLCLLFLCTFVLFPILVTKREVFVKFFAPIIVLFCYGLIVINSDNYQVPSVWYGVVYSGVLRGYAGMCLGVISYEARKKLDSLKATSTNIAVVTATPIAFIIFTVWFAFQGIELNTLTVLFIPLMCLLVATSFSSKNIISKPLEGPVCEFFGKFSLSIFLCHYYVANLMPWFAEDLMSNRATATYFVVVFAVSIVNYILGKLLIYKRTRKPVAGILVLSVVLANIFL